MCQSRQPDNGICDSSGDAVVSESEALAQARGQAPSLGHRARARCSDSGSPPILSRIQDNVSPPAVHAQNEQATQHQSAKVDKHVIGNPYPGHTDLVAPSSGAELSRRRFLISTAAASASLHCLALRRICAGEQMPGRGARERSRVIQVKSDAVITDFGIHEGLLSDLVSVLITRVTGQRDASQGWRALLGSEDVIGLKLERGTANGIGTSEAVFRAVTASLIGAGFRRQQIIAIDVTPSVRRELGVGQPASGWSRSAVDFKSGQDRLAAWLEQVTAIVNVAPIATHNICEFSGCLWNLSHSVIKHPAQFFGQKGSPHVGNIVSLPAVRDKLRVNIANGLRIPFHRGHDATEDDIWNAGMLVGGTDPVAVDAIGVKLVDEARRAVRLEPLAKPGSSLAYIEHASRKGVGQSRLHGIEWVKVEI